MKRTPILLGAVAGAAALGLAAALWVVPAAVHSGDYDLPGMLGAIANNNQKIGQVNQKILSSLGEVAQATAGVDRVQQRLSTMESLVQEQSKTMAGLVKVTQDQVVLSRQLADLTATVQPGTAGMARTAASEAETLGAMAKTTQSIASNLQEIGAVNRSSATKLKRAEELTAVVLIRLP